MNQILVVPMHLIRFADTWINGWSSVASSLNGLGVLYYRTNRFEEVRDSVFVF